jgi:hydroxymethylglutaryl-CoA lyase
MNELRRSILFSRLPSSAAVVEVGPRDGLQNEPRVIPAAAKIAFVEALAAAGLRHVEVSSFVSPARVPQLADAEEVCRGLQRRSGVTYTALVPNEKGLERALSAGIDSIALLTAASETFNRRNLGCTIGESLERARRLVERARPLGLRLRAYISTAFVCPYEGLIPPERVLTLVEELRAMGVANLSLGDTLGAAFPDAVSRLLELLEERGPLEGIALHLHDTYRRALSNVLAGLLHGIREFDASAGGLGGCPFAPGARGNLATEELVDFLEGMGIATGVDATKLREASAALGRGTAGPTTS